MKYFLQRVGCHALIVVTLYTTVSVSSAESLTANGISDDVVRIGFATDLYGPYEAVDGKAGAEAILMAIADLGGTVAGKRVELIALDHRNDPKRAAALATELFDVRHADMLIGGVNTDTSLAMIGVARAHRKPFLVVGAGSSRHTNEQCSPYTVQWAYDTTALSKVTANGIVREGGRKCSL